MVGLGLGLILPAASRCGGDDASLLDCLRSELDTRTVPDTGVTEATTPAEETTPGAPEVQVPGSPVDTAAVRTPEMSEAGPAQRPATVPAVPQPLEAPPVVPAVPEPVARPATLDTPGDATTKSARGTPATEEGTRAAPPAPIRQVTPAVPAPSGKVTAAVPAPPAPSAAADERNAGAPALVAAVPRPATPQPPPATPSVPRQEKSVSDTSSPAPASEPVVPAVPPASPAPLVPAVPRPMAPPPGSAPAPEAQTSVAPSGSSDARPLVPAVPPPAAPAILAAVPAPPPAEVRVAPQVIIDAVEVEDDMAYVSGSAPTGARVSLFVNGEWAGDSAVRDGRWQVSGPGLLPDASQTLRVEARAADGALLAESRLTIQIAGRVVPAVPPPHLSSRSASPADPPAVVPAVPLAGNGSRAAPPNRAMPEPPLVSPLVPEVPLTMPPEDASPSTPFKPAIIPAVPTPAGETGPPADAADVSAPPVDLVHKAKPATVEPALLARFTVPALAMPVAEDADPAPVVQLQPSQFGHARRLSFGKAVIRPGDTLWGLARRYYGTGVGYLTIFRANQELIRHPSRIFPGQVFVVPLVLDR